MSAPVRMWVTEPPAPEVRLALQHLAETDDVLHIAVMPDVHLAYGVCIGTVTATRSRLFPAAVGRDIGCGMTAMRFRAPASVLASADNAATMLDGLYRAVPFIKHRSKSAPGLPEDIAAAELSAPSLDKLAARDGLLQFGTLGRGNHFLEFQAELVKDLFGVDADPDTFIDCDHNHVQRESHRGQDLWVHRKGALQAREGQPGVIPGSMGSASYHVTGRGEPEALESSSHGAGRAMSRSEARRRIPKKRLLKDAEGVWFDHRHADRLREEGPGAYKDIGTVMRAQRKLTRIVRRLEPVLVHKGV